MSTRKTVDVMVCDRCGAEGVKYRSGAFARGGRHVRNAEVWGRAYDGAVGGGTVDYDLCQDCEAAFGEWIRRAKETDR
jgi:hypothetical protein